MVNTLPLEKFIPENWRVSNPSRKLYHIFNEADCYALWAAYSSGRPLLVRGQPGTGKSQMARAIAEQLGWAFVSETIRGSTELSDLHWHFDAIGRLGEAQALATAKVSSDRTFNSRSATIVNTKLDPLNFLTPGPFWWAYHWHTAEKQYRKCKTRTCAKPEMPDQTPQGRDWNAKNGGVVLLLDEIDKAEPDLPNGLLETLGAYYFTVPYVDHQSEGEAINPIHADSKKLLVVITTNEERELPKAFVRRCFVHTLKMEESVDPIDAEALQPLPKRLYWLMERGRLHFGEDIAETVYHLAAKLLWQDREANPHTQYPPGLAEYIDLLKALRDLTHSEQQQRLDKIASYALKKELQN